jgi:hypothetical protein
MKVNRRKSVNGHRYPDAHIKELEERREKKKKLKKKMGIGPKGAMKIKKNRNMAVVKG